MALSLIEICETEGLAQPPQRDSERERCRSDLDARQEGLKQRARLGNMIIRERPTGPQLT